MSPSNSETYDSRKKMLTSLIELSNLALISPIRMTADGGEKGGDELGWNKVVAALGRLKRFPTYLFRC